VSTNGLINLWNGYERARARKSPTLFATIPIAALFLCCLALRADAAAIELGKDYDVRCGEHNCGSVKFSDYSSGFDKLANGTIKDAYELIKGAFTPADSHLYHWVQALTKDTNPLAWRGDGVTKTPVPYVDTPPQGYVGAGNAFDNLLYYDQPDDDPKFPGFYDRPQYSYRTINGNVDKIASESFETWLVCVISPNPDPADPGDFHAKDIRYDIAPIFGFTWGFTATLDKTDPTNPDKGSVTRMALSTIAAPSADWKNALNQVYGAGAKTDRFNVTLSQCTNCTDAVVPEPSMILLFSPGLIVLAYFRRMRSFPMRPKAVNASM